MMIKIRNKTGENSGAVTVFAVLMTILLVSVFFAIFIYAQIVSSAGISADAVSLADNAVKASYNKNIWDAYGLTCYTQSAARLSDEASYYVDRSLAFDAEAVAEVKFTGKTLADGSEFLSQVDSYMKRWDLIAPNVSYMNMYSYKNVMKNSAKIRKVLEKDLKAETNGYLGSQIVVSIGNKDSTPQEGSDAALHLKELEEKQKADTARENVLKTITPDKITIRYLSPASFDYTGPSGLMAPRKMTVDNSLSSRENVQAAVDTMKRVEEYFSPIDSAMDSKIFRKSTYHLALYAANNFSAYHYYGSTALTGNYYGSGDVTSLSPWGENEFLLNAGGSDEENIETVRDMIFDLLFTEYMVKLYYSVTDDSVISDYSYILGNGAPQSVKLIKDEYIVGLAAQMAYNALVESYEWKDNDDIILDKYIYFVELFDMLEAQRNTGEFVKRMQYLIDKNAAQSPSSEARQFKCAKAATVPCISSCMVTTDIIVIGEFNIEVR